MTTTVRVPGSLQRWFDGRTETTCQGSDISECLADLSRKFPGLPDMVAKDARGQAKVIVFLNGDNIRQMEGLATKVSDGDEICIIPLAAGG